jgi:hypothetical protein
MIQKSTTTIEKEEKRGRTKENSGTNRKAEDIEITRTEMTKGKHTNRKFSKPQETAQIDRKGSGKHGELKSEEKEQNVRRRENQRIQKEEGESDAMQTMRRTTGHRTHRDEEQAPTEGTATAKCRAE